MATWWYPLPPALDSRPRLNEPPGLHEPHQPAHTVWLRLASEVIE